MKFEAPPRPASRTIIVTALTSVALYAVPVSAQTHTLTFDAPQTAGISGLRVMWDAPTVLAADGASAMADWGRFGKAVNALWFPSDKERQNADGTLKPGALAFDADHRSLLVRFPGSAQGIAEELNKGFVIQKVELELPFKSTELWPEGYNMPVGMSFLGDQWAYWKPNWHAVAWELRKPWVADAKIGPTYNAFINGAGYWAKYGAQDTANDRFPNQFGPAEVSATVPDGRVDVTQSLTDPQYGATLADRLREMDSCGFLVRKWEIYDMALYQGGYEWQTATGPHAILIDTPKLLVTFAPGPAAKIDPSKLTVDVTQLAASLQKRHQGGAPTAVMPTADEIARFAAQFKFSRPAGIPDWQWQRLQELYGLGGGNDFPSTPDAYDKWIDGQLGHPPRTWGGFDATSLVEDYFRYLPALPEPVRDQWKLYWWAWLEPDRDFLHGIDFNGKHYGFSQGYVGGADARAYYNETHDWRGNADLYRTYCYTMGTMNFNYWNDIGTLGGGEILGSKRLIDDGNHGIEQWPLRTWSWLDGSTQESIDHYYFPLSIGAGKAIEDDSTSEFGKMVGQSVITKNVEELASCWHPNLRRFISSSGRTGFGLVLCSQDGLSYIMDTLSPSGALTDMPAPGSDPKVETTVTSTNADHVGVFNRNLQPGRVAQQFLESPWAPDWMSNIVEGKPLPYYSINDYKQWGMHSAHPLWKVSYLGRNYGLASLDATTSESVPLLAEWRREETPATSMTQIGTLLARGGTNYTNLLDTEYHGCPHTHENLNPGGMTGNQGMLNYTFQHKNKAIFLTSPNKKLVYDSNYATPAGISSIETTIGLMNFEKSPRWKIYVDGQQVTQFPVQAKLSQRITIQDGVSYVGLIPLPATDLGRDAEVVLSNDGVMTEVTGGGSVREALRINIYNMKAAAPIPYDSPAWDWNKVERAYSGFVAEIGDETEYPSFDAFQKHIASATLSSVPDPTTGIVNISYQSGDDTMECTYNPNPATGETNDIFPVRKVNGAWPYNPPGIDRDTTLTQQGTTGILQKSGAVLVSQPGIMSYLLTEPKTKTTCGFNPYSNPTLWSLTTPSGVAIKADGRLAMARVALQETTGKLSVAYALLDQQKTLPDMAANLYLFGLDHAPVADLNGAPANLQKTTIDGKPAFVLSLVSAGATPIAEGDETSRFDAAQTALTSGQEVAQAANQKLLAGNAGLEKTMLTNWRIVGPFANAGIDGPDDGPATDYLQGQIKPDATYPGIDGKPVTWMPLTADAVTPTGSVYLDRVYDPKHNVTAYATANINSPMDQTVTLITSCNDVMSAWLNGQKVVDKEIGGSVESDDNRCQISLKKGDNSLLLKVTETTGGYPFAYKVRVGDAAGLPIDGITFSAAP